MLLTLYEEYWWEPPPTARRRMKRTFIREFRERVVSVAKVVQYVLAKRPGTEIIPLELQDFSDFAWKGITPFPFYNRATRSLEHGVRCRGCDREWIDYRDLPWHIGMFPPDWWDRMRSLTKQGSKRYAEADFGKHVLEDCERAREILRAYLDGKGEERKPQEMIWVNGVAYEW